LGRRVSLGELWGGGFPWGRKISFVEKGLLWEGRFLWGEVLKGGGFPRGKRVFLKGFLGEGGFP